MCTTGPSALHTTISALKACRPHQTFLTLFSILAASIFVIPGIDLDDIQVIQVRVLNTCFFRYLRWIEDSMIA